MELTRAINYIFDMVRKYLLHSFRLHEGALMVERDGVGFDMHTEHLRPEYRGGERTDRPYPGLQDFLKVRYTRDFFLRPDPEDV